MSHPVPSPDEQLRFLRNFQRLLDEGSFVASYKFALLHAIADLCVVHGSDTGAPLTLTTEQISERFIDLYWMQARPFPAGEVFDVLSQNTGRQAAVVREVHEAREEYGGSLAGLRRRGREWRRLLKAVESTVRVMPLWRLQTMGERRVEFLYENRDRGREIELLPGVAYCFRAFHPLITDVVEGAWTHFVRERNRSLLGPSAELRDFLFGAERDALARYRPILEDLQKRTCFYCGGGLTKSSMHVDHFIPWRRYPTDLGHNFVLAHGRCNSSKADLLAAERHLERWQERNVKHEAVLVERFEEAGVRHDLGASLSVAQWAYGQVEAAGGQVWVERAVLEGLSGEWRRILAA